MSYVNDLQRVMEFVEQHLCAFPQLPSTLPHSSGFPLNKLSLFLSLMVCRYTTTLLSSWYASSWPLTCFISEKPIPSCNLVYGATYMTRHWRRPPDKGSRITVALHLIACCVLGLELELVQVSLWTAVAPASSWIILTRASSWIISPNWTSWARAPTDLTLKVGHSKFILLRWCALGNLLCSKQ